jgi:hypothetical protein
MARARASAASEGFSPRGGARCVESSVGRLGFRQSGAAEDEDGVPDALALETDLGLQIVELQPRRADFVAAEKGDVFIRFAIARARQNALDPRWRLGIVLCGFRLTPWQVFSSIGRWGAFAPRRPGLGGVCRRA